MTVLRADIDIAKTEVRIELQDLRTDLTGTIQGVRLELKTEIQDVRAGLQGLSNELQELRGEIKAQLPKLITANIASMIGVAGLVLGAVAIG